MLSRHCVPVIGNGVVIDLAALLEEIDELQARGVSCDKLLVSANAHLIMPYHRALDKVSERFLGKAKIGTTGRGIGPTYGDKVARVGIRVQDLLDVSILRKKLELVLREKNQVLVKVYNRKAIDVGAVVDEYLGYAQRLRPYIADTRLILARALESINLARCQSPRERAAWPSRSSSRHPPFASSKRRPSITSCSTRRAT